MILFRRLRPKPYQWRVDAPDEPDTKWVHFNGALTANAFRAEYMVHAGNAAHAAATAMRADVDRVMVDQMMAANIQAVDPADIGAVPPVGEPDMVIIDDIDNEIQQLAEELEVI